MSAVSGRLDKSSGCVAFNSCARKSIVLKSGKPWLGTAGYGACSCRPDGKIAEPWLGTGDLILIRSSGSWISGRAVAE